MSSTTGRPDRDTHKISAFKKTSPRTRHKTSPQRSSKEAPAIRMVTPASSVEGPDRRPVATSCPAVATSRAKRMPDTMESIPSYRVIPLAAVFLQRWPPERSLCSLSSAEHCASRSLDSPLLVAVWLWHGIFPWAELLLLVQPPSPKYWIQPPSIQCLGQKREPSCQAHHLANPPRSCCAPWANKAWE